MTNELIKTFFDTFGIEPYDRYLNCTKNLEVDCNRNCNCCDKAEDVYCYPEITDHILLELTVIMTRYTDIIDGFANVQELKKFVLEELMYSLTQPECNIVKQQVRTLFEEGS